MKDKLKHSLYMPQTMMDEVVAEATRQDRSLSWVVQQAWMRAREKIAAVPSAPEQRRASSR
jgi:uncharacterized small protein (TIGR04563 family)